MQIAAGRGNRSVSEGRLNQMDWCAVIERVRSVRVAQPVGGSVRIHSSTGGGIFDDPKNARAVERLPRLRWEYRRVRERIRP